MPDKVGVGFLHSAEVVLREAGTPLTCRVIVERATKAGLLTSRGKTPANTLSAMLNRHIESEGRHCVFMKVGPGTFGLRKKG